ncbi:lactate racemase domain-containing protein [Granulicoccus phenolivorans]|uniref:lactate racemase domain-containing protein n=1 Tax=Granulicoccus phenolivorans TaxID=266854 RepID=UPI00041F3009|nr:lactate racemase domain-containing protein [Granulicoccus phenolivorans]
MSRPGFLLETDERTPELLVPAGPGVRMQRMPRGTEVLYPSEALDRVPDSLEAIDKALATPLGSAPLRTRLAGVRRLALVVTDSARPAPAMAGSDIRATVLERILELAATARVDEVTVLLANGLRRKMSGSELQQLTGERVHRSFFHDGKLFSHDATQTRSLTTLADGVSVNEAVGQADLVINLNVTGELGHTNGRQLTRGITGQQTAWAQLGLDPDPATEDRVLAEITSAVPVFAVDVVLSPGVWTGPLRFLSKREWEWQLQDRAAAAAVQRALTIAPRQTRRRLFAGATQDYGVLAVHAGGIAEVTGRTTELLSAQQSVEVVGQSDVLITGPASTTEHNVDAVMNPLVAAWDCLAHSFGSHAGTPAVRPGGVMICFAPLAQAFSARFDTAAADFFAEVLPETTDATVIRDRFEARFATDEWYRHQYATQGAHHGLHPLELWYAIQPAVRHCSDIIWVGADRAAAARLGFRAASTLADALEIASAQVGRTPRIRLLHTPPVRVQVTEATA